MTSSLSGNQHFLSGHQIISLYFNANSSFPKNIPNLSHFTPSLQFNSVLILSHNTTLSKLGPNSVQSGESSIEVEGSGEIITIISREFSLQGEEDKMKCFCFLQDRLNGSQSPSDSRSRYIYIFVFISLLLPPAPLQTLKEGVKILIRNVERRLGNQDCWGRGRGKGSCVFKFAFQVAFLNTIKQTEAEKLERQSKETKAKARATGWGPGPCRSRPLRK